MVQDPYGVLADERINDDIDFDKVKNKEDYEKEVRRVLDGWDKRKYNLLKAGSKEFYKNGKKNPNYQKTSFKDVISKMYEHSKSTKEIIKNYIKSEPVKMNERRLGLNQKQVNRAVQFKKLEDYINEQDRVTKQNQEIIVIVNSQRGYFQYRNEKQEGS